MTFKEKALLFVMLGGPALLGGLILQQLSCSIAHACLQVALEFQPEGRQQFSHAEFWRGAAGYGLGVWIGLQLGYLSRSLCQGRRRSLRAIAWRSALGVLLGLAVVYIVTASRWGIDIPQPSSQPGTPPPPPTHIALEWPGADHIPDALEWWILVLCSWVVTVCSTWWLTRNVIRDT